MKALAAEKDGFELPLTSLIDVVFLLLVFFLVATTFTRKEYDQQVDLPSGTQAQAVTPSAGDMLVNIRREGTLIVDGRIVALAQLEPQVKEWMEQATGGRLLLRADTGVDYGRVAEVLERCRGCGVRKIGLTVSGKGGTDAE